MSQTLKSVSSKEAGSNMYLMEEGNVVSEPLPASELSVWNTVLLPESNKGGGCSREKTVQHQASWLKFHVQEGVPSLPHCLGNPHRGTSGQMQSTKQAVKHISSLRPMGAHLVNEQEKTPQ